MIEPVLGPVGRLESAAETNETVRVTGVVVELWVTESHGVVVEADTPVSGELPVVPTLTCGKVGTLPPIV